MKKIIALALVALLALTVFAGCDKTPQSIKDNPSPFEYKEASASASVSPAVFDTGLVQYLIPRLLDETGITLEIADGEGDIDIGADDSGNEFAQAYMAIVGPESDPAGVKNCTTAADALDAAGSANGYTVTTKADYLMNPDYYSDVTVLYESDETEMLALFFVTANGDEDVQTRLIEWFTNAKTAKLITSFGIADFGEALFITPPTADAE